VKSNKNIWILSLTLLLVFLQPLVSFGYVPTASSEIVNPQEEFALIKTQSAKAIVLQEVSVSAAELIVTSDSGRKGFLFEYNNSEKPEKLQKESCYLIDFRSVLTTQIFPFHFFL
jgi:hypothetical protein